MVYKAFNSGTVNRVQDYWSGVDAAANSIAAFNVGLNGYQARNGGGAFSLTGSPRSAGRYFWTADAEI